ncbi:hypothetical protein [Achromobacter sp. HZ28]|uniref:hypothetical protein n=1 Tax=Achromobacter sp. HZ28 TaxID=2015171 RepID=UPI001303D113|nr:hypothetical protein [Achromobacter sp. HZ28]
MSRNPFEGAGGTEFSANGANVANVANAPDATDATDATDAPDVPPAYSTIVAPDTGSTAPAALGAFVAGDGVSGVDGVDPAKDSWTALQGMWDDVNGAPRADVSRSVDTLYEALMSHAEQHSSASAAAGRGAAGPGIAKALVGLVECTAIADYATLRSALFDGTLNPHLNGVSLERSRVLARLQDPTDAGRQAIIEQAGKLLASSAWFKKKRNPNAPQALQDARALVIGLLDALGMKGHDIVAQREWTESISQARSAVDDMLNLPIDQHQAAGARLVRALRKMRNASDTLDFTQSVDARLGSLIDGLSPGMRMQLENLCDARTAQGTATAAGASTRAEMVNAFIKHELHKYETDERMQEKLHIFWEKLGNWTSLSCSPAIDGVAHGAPFLESGYRRSWTVIRHLSRLYQRLRGWSRKQPLKTNNAIKDLVDGLVGNKTMSAEKLSKKRIMLNLAFTADAGAAPARDEAQARPDDGAGALAYLQHTLRKLTPRELQALETVLTEPQELTSGLAASLEQHTLQTILADAQGLTRELKSSPALHTALVRSLRREIHIRELQRYATDIQAALNLGRRGKANARRRGQALIAALDDCYATAAQVPNDQSAVELMTLAMQRQGDRKWISSLALQDRRLVASAADDMNLALRHKSDDGKRCRQHLLEVCAYAAQRA